MINKLAKLVSYSVLATLFTFILQTFATYSMSPIEFGEFAKWLTDIGYLSIFLVFGLDYSLLYFGKQEINIPKFIGNNIVFYTATSIISFFILNLIRHEKYILNVSLVISVYCFSITSLIIATYQLKEKFSTYGKLFFSRSALVALPFIFTFIFQLRINSEFAAAVYAAGSLFTAILFLLIYLKNNKIEFSINIKIKEYYLYGIKGMLNKLLAIAMYSSTTYFLYYASTKEEVAYFFIAATLSKLIWILPDTAGNLLYPQFIKIHSKKSHIDAISNLYYYAQLLLFINIAIIVSFLIIGKSVINIIYSLQYQSIYIPTIILLIGNQGMIYFKLLSRYLSAKNNWHSLHKALVTGIVSNLVFNLIFTPKYGVIGAACSTALSFWVCGLTTSFFVPGSTINFLKFDQLIIRFFKK